LNDARQFLNITDKCSTNPVKITITKSYALTQSYVGSLQKCKWFISLPLFTVTCSDIHTMNE